MRLVDADALIKRFKALKIRSKELTIDYKRGHGVMHVYPNGEVMCSACKQRMPLKWKKMPSYCFKCGAKMDGELNE